MFNVVANPNVSRAQYALSPRYSTLEAAFNAMGDGCVINADGRLVAFHKRHWWLVEAGSISWEL